MLQPPPRTLLPTEPIFLAELCDSTPDNFIYIRPYTPSNLDAYVEIQYYLHLRNGSPQTNPMPREEIKAGMLVTIRVITGSHKQFFRATVLDDVDAAGQVRCFKYDDGRMTSVSVKNVYQIYENELLYPALAMKCRLAGLELFDGMPHLQKAYEMVKLTEIREEPHYETMILEVPDDDIPVVRMVMNGVQLTATIQNWIPIVCDQQLNKAAANYRPIISDPAVKTQYLKPILSGSARFQAEEFSDPSVVRQREVNLSKMINSFNKQVESELFKLKNMKEQQRNSREKRPKSESEVDEAYSSLDIAEV